MRRVPHEACRSVGRRPLSTPSADGQNPLAALRETLARLERRGHHPLRNILSVGLPEMAKHLPGGGLPTGMLHEVMAASHQDRPSAFGFAFALAASALRSRKGPAFFVSTRHATWEFGRLSAHGLRHLGIDPRRFVLIETAKDKDALWALEETLRTEVRPAIVVGALSRQLDLTASRRLNLASAAGAVPLVLLCMTGGQGANAAGTRWRIRTAPSSKDRFGGLGDWRWRTTLERSRNGRSGQWLLEWTHVAHSLRMAEGVADRTPDAGQAPRRAG
jgi:protein ImuA